MDGLGLHTAGSGPGRSVQDVNVNGWIKRCYQGIMLIAMLVEIGLLSLLVAHEYGWLK